MNPIFQQMQKSPRANINPLKGIGNPRDYVLNAVNNMNPAQKSKLISLLPMAQNIASKQGMNISNIVNELQSRM